MDVSKGAQVGGERHQPLKAFSKPELPLPVLVHGRGEVGTTSHRVVARMKREDHVAASSLQLHSHHENSV